MTTSVYRERGGARWGLKRLTDQINVSWPFATLTVSNQTLRVRVNAVGVLKREFIVPSAQLQRLTLRPGMLGPGLFIDHQVPELPETLIFWTFRPRRLAGALAAFGYKLSERRA